MQDSSSQLTDPGDDALSQAAAAWLARRDAGFTAAQAAAFERWRDADPRHAAALRHAEATQRLLSRLPESPSAQALLAEVDALVASRPRVIPFSTLWKSAAGLAAAAAIAFAFFHPRPQPLESANATYTTAAGQHQSLNLPDGSTLVLSSASQVEVAFVPTERRVHLQHGEAHFYVAKDTARPFVVSAGDVSVRAVGTAFNVRRHTAGVEVLVTEGKVQVSRTDAAAPEPIYLVAGERAFVDGLAAAAFAASLPATERAADRPPRLMFNNTPLSDVIERFNRYSRIQIEIADPELAARGVGGNFDADNADAFIDLLNKAGDVRIERVSPDRVLLHKAR
jgi:Fe2+-dicitrate sensor, membrane component